MARILVVDGNVTVKQFYQLILENEGYEVDSSLSVEEALNDILPQSFFDLVITGFEFFGLKGDMLCRVIKNEYPGLPVIMITGGVFPERCLADAIYRKPIKKEDLLSLVAIWIKK